MKLKHAVQLFCQGLMVVAALYSPDPAYVAGALVIAATSWGNE